MVNLSFIVVNCMHSEILDILCICIVYSKFLSDDQHISSSHCDELKRKDLYDYLLSVLKYYNIF